MGYRVFACSLIFCALSSLGSKAHARELTPEEIRDLVARTSQRTNARPVDDAALHLAADKLSTILSHLADGHASAPSANALLNLAKEKGAGSALIAPAVSLLDAASLAAMPEVSGDILSMISTIDGELADGLRGHMAAIGMGRHLNRIDENTARDMFATLGARLGYNTTAPVGEITLEKASGIRSPVSGFNSAEFMASAASGNTDMLQRRSGDQATEKQSVMEKLKTVDWVEVADEAVSKGGLGAVTAGTVARVAGGPFWQPIGAAIGGTLGALWGAGRELERQIGNNPEPKTDDEDPQGPSIGPAPGTGSDDDGSGDDTDDDTPDEDNSGDDADCSGSGGQGCDGNGAGENGYTPNVDGEGGSSGGGGRPITPDSGDSDPRPGDEGPGRPSSTPVRPIEIIGDGVTDFGDPSVRDRTVTGPTGPILTDDGVVDPPERDIL